MHCWTEEVKFSNISLLRLFRSYFFVPLCFLNRNLYVQYIIFSIIQMISFISICLKYIQRKLTSRDDGLPAM